MPIYKTKKTKDGKTQYRVIVSFTDIHGNYKQVSKVCYGLTEAKALERQLQIETANYLPEENMTVYDLYIDYCQSKKYEVRETTLEKSQSIIENHILPYFKDKKISKITMQEIQKWKNALSEKKYKVTTKNNILKSFKAMLNYAVKMEYIQKSPLDKVDTFREPYFASTQKNINYYTPEEFKKYIAVAKESIKTQRDYGYYVFFNIAFFTGMRKGEINALKWSDIDGDIIHITRSITQKTKGGYSETPPKNKSSVRDLQMPLNLVKILKEYNSIQRQNKAYTDDFRVCGGDTILPDTTIEKRNAEFSKKAGLKHIRIHDFRHSHASVLCNEGINIQEVARRLGHADISMTLNTYSHLYPREEERAVKILEKIS